MIPRGPSENVIPALILLSAWFHFSTPCQVFQETTFTQDLISKSAFGETKANFLSLNLVAETQDMHIWTLEVVSVLRDG